MSNANNRKVHIYIDNSNVYIEGGKVHSSASDESPTVDLSWRYSVRNLRNVLLNKSDLSIGPVEDISIHTNLYGSEPPPDDVWKAMRSQDVTIHKFERSTWTNKEKQVDTKMVADIVEQATSDRIYGIRSEFIIVSGDADLLPAVKMVCKNGFRAHVWSWSKGFSHEYTNKWVEDYQHNLSVHYLDDFKDDFGFYREATEHSTLDHSPSQKRIRTQQPQQHQKIPQQQTRCYWGKYCKAAGKCQYYHPREDRDYFEQHGGPKPLRYYVLCKWGAACTREDCTFFHNEAQRICPTCDKAGQKHGEIGSPEWRRAHRPGEDS